MFVNDFTKRNLIRPPDNMKISYSENISQISPKTTSDGAPFPLLY